jgi:hypothetical protein
MQRRTYLTAGLVCALAVGCGSPASTGKSSAATSSPAPSGGPKVATQQPSKASTASQMDVPPPPRVNATGEKKGSKAPNDEAPNPPPPVKANKPTAAGKDS